MKPPQVDNIKKKDTFNDKKKKKKEKKKKKQSSQLQSLVFVWIL